MPSLRPNVLAAKERLAEGYVAFQRQHEEGRPGVELCAAISDLRDEVLVDLTEAALSDLNEAGSNGLWPEIAWWPMPATGGATLPLTATWT